MAVSRAERKAWAREQFRGFENSLIPSFTPDLQDLDEEGIRLDVRQSIAHGFFATFTGGAGLNLEEKKRLLAIAADEAGGRVSVGFSLGAGPVT